jgi:PAS domain S-box-containing protein
MSKFLQSSLSRYGIATVAVVSALILTLLLGTSAVLQPSLLFLVAVMISAWYGGLRSGLLSLALSVLAIGYFFLPPAYSFMTGLSDTLRIILFAVVAAPISLIISAHKRSEEKLRKSEELQRITLSNISDAIFLTDGKGDFTYVCPNVHMIFGYSESEVVAFGNICRLLGKGWFDPHELETAGEITNIELKITDKVGARRVVLASVKRVAIKDGTVLYACREITQRKQVEEEQTRRIREESARAEAEAANRAKDDFLAVVSHELRSPLNAMLGWAKLLHGGKLNEATVTHAGEVIERNARSQAQLIDDLLDISRIVAGNLRLDLHAIDLAPVIEAAVDDISPVAESKAIQTRISLDPAAGRVLGDLRRLKQVVWNLLSNAVKFTPQGGSVEVRLSRAESGARITVSDTGKGIKAEFLPNIFDRYRQEGKEAGKGLGLGLNIVRSLVELHGGTVQAESRGEGQGAAFTVTLPWAGALPEPTPAGDFNKIKMG